MSVWNVVRFLFGRPPEKAAPAHPLLYDEFGPITPYARSGPMYNLPGRENHGLGYHVHLEKRSAKAYVRTNVVLTVEKHAIYAFFHAEGNSREPLTWSQLSSRSFADEIARYCDTTLFYRPDEKDWLPIPEKARKKGQVALLFNL